ncbi:MAG: ATP-binding cassette domain-containing protein [Desulfuromonadales bacterium]|nr:ATP-binding cassette domain-containing protein [Desulfuromonadales bacterium]
MIEVKYLVFEYPGTRALKGVSFQIKPGNITALVGPNGAGKTTLLRCMAALEVPLYGEVRIDGENIHEDPRACHRKLGYLSDFFGLYDELTVRQCLLHAAASRGILAGEQVRVTEQAAARLGIVDRLEMKSGTLSRGLRQRLAIAQAVVHEPQILMLDEPASGLDPEARHSLAELFLALRDQGMTLVVSSHILSELDEYSTDMLVLREGRILSHDPIEQPAEATVRLKLSLTGPFNGLQALLSGMAGVSAVEGDDGTAVLSFSGDAAARHRLLKSLLDRGLPVCAFAEQHRNMQSAYLQSVRRRDSQEGVL